MREVLNSIAESLAQSGAREWMVEALRTVPGMPPVVQTLHILCIAVVMASAVLIHLRSLKLAVTGQDLTELKRRMAGWFWCAIPLLLASGAVFVLARPFRYFSNPVFGIKMASLVAVLALTVWIFRLIRTAPERTASWPFKLANLLALCLWLNIVLAGRWIAYVDYLFPP